MAFLKVTVDSSEWRRSKANIYARLFYWREHLPRTFAKKYSSVVAKRIIGQDFPKQYKPLSGLTLLLKGGNTMHWWFTGSLYNELVTMDPELVHNNANSTVYKLKFSDGAMNKIVWGEYGTGPKRGKYHGGVQPPRPLFEPTLAEFKDMISDEIMEVFTDLQKNFH